MITPPKFPPILRPHFPLGLFPHILWGEPPRFHCSLIIIVITTYRYAVKSTFY